ncbi:MAG: hypothetical protein JO180_09985 [Gemmatirosa sp.]|nr:hypothetical protein [Gemmatirosa sp.]
MPLRHPLRLAAVLAAVALLGLLAGWHARRRVRALVQGDVAGAVRGTPLARVVDRLQRGPAGPRPCTWSCACVVGPSLELRPPAAGLPDGARVYGAAPGHPLHRAARTWLWVERGAGAGAVCVGAVTRVEPAPWEPIPFAPAVTAAQVDSVARLPADRVQPPAPYVYAAVPAASARDGFRSHVDAVRRLWAMAPP